MSDQVPLLEASGLTVRFGKVAALDGFDLVAGTGQLLAILGPNGAGKTTFVRAVATLVRPAGGTLRVLGHDVAGDPIAVRREIGLAGQFAAVEPTMTGLENLQMTARLFGHRRRAAARAAATVIDLLDLGAVAGRRCATYSGGQRRRLDLGASLVGAPRLLLLDEPTTGLDPVSRREVWAAVRGLAQAGTNVLLTTHYLEEADELADHVVIIDHGRAVAAGPLAELKANIGRDVIEVEVSQPGQLSAAAQVLSAVTGSEPRVDPLVHRASVTVGSTSQPGAAALAAVLTGLAGQHVSVGEIGVRRPTLDEVFLTLTGHRAGRQGQPESAGRRLQGSAR